MTAPLPRMLAELAEIVGEAGALRVAHAYGGRSLYVPKTMRPDHAIALEVGLDNAQALCTLYGNEEIVLPLGPTGSAARSREAIGKGIAAGLSAAKTAAIAGVAERTVWRHRQRRRGDDDQGDLFG